MTGRMPYGPAWDAAVLERNWLAYQLVPRKDSEKLDKHPACPRSGKAPISVHEAAKLTLAEAREAIARLGLHGVGYMPRSNSALVGLDIDDAWREDRHPPSVRSLIQCCTTYLERSPSGRGVRIIVARDPTCPVINTERNGLGYFGRGGKFFTVTFEAHAWKREILPAPAFVAAMLRLIGGTTQPQQQQQSAAPARARDATAPPHWFDTLPERQREQEVKRMLACLTDPAHGLDYELWLRISFAVHRATDSTGFDLWDAWCQGLPGYNAAKNARKWRTFDTERPDPCSVGTLIHHAKAHGYRPPLPRLATGQARILRRLARISARMQP